MTLTMSELDWIEHNCDLVSYDDMINTYHTQTLVKIIDAARRSIEMDQRLCDLGVDPDHILPPPPSMASEVVPEQMGNRLSEKEREIERLQTHWIWGDHEQLKTQLEAKDQEIERLKRAVERNYSLKNAEIKAYRAALEKIAKGMHREGEIARAVLKGDRT